MSSMFATIAIYGMVALNLILTGYCRRRRTTFIRLSSLNKYKATWIGKNTPYIMYDGSFQQS